MYLWSFPSHANETDNEFISILSADDQRAIVLLVTHTHNINLNIKLTQSQPAYNIHNYNFHCTCAEEHRNTFGRTAIVESENKRCASFFSYNYYCYLAKVFSPSLSLTHTLRYGEPLSIKHFSHNFNCWIFGIHVIFFLKTNFSFEYSIISTHTHTHKLINWYSKNPILLMVNFA